MALTNLFSIHKACKSGNLSRLKMIIFFRNIIEKKFDIDAKDENHCTCLLYAAGNGHLSIVEYLCRKNSSVNENYFNTYTPLCIAALYGHNQIVKFLIDKGANINDPGEEGRTALHEAASNGHLETVTTLVEHQADINVRDEKGYSPLFYALDNWGKAKNTAKYLLSCGADNKLQMGSQSLGTTNALKKLKTLTLSAVKRSMDEFELKKFALSGTDSDVNLAAVKELGRWRHTDSLKDVATETNKIHVFTTSINCLVNDCGHTYDPHFVGNMIERFIGRSVGDNLESLHALLSKDGQQRLISYLIENGKVDGLKCIIKHNDIDLDEIIEDKSLSFNVMVSGEPPGKTPLIMAIHFRQEEICKLLIDSGANVNKKEKILQSTNEYHDMDTAKTVNGNTPLVVAQNNSMDVIVQLLCAKGAHA